MTSIWVTRWILVALSLVLAAFLVARGNVIIGALIGVMAVTRAVTLVGLRRRREELRRRIAQRRGFGRQ